MADARQKSRQPVGIGHSHLEERLALEVDRVYRNLLPGTALPEGRLNVLTGPNNSGKSSILQFLNNASSISQDSDYVSPRRFDVSNQVAVALNSEEELRNLWNQRKQVNEEIAELTAPDPIRELIFLPDSVREHICDWHGRYFGDLRVDSSNPANRFAPPRITVDGRLASQQGSGSRAVLSVLTTLLHPERAYVLIDEPEIGIEPKVQRRLFDLIKRVSEGRDGLRQKNVYLATHSHLFLDRDQPRNNWIVRKDNSGWARLSQVQHTAELLDLVYNLLGSHPGDLFFPENILVVEGPSDSIYWRRLLQLSGVDGVAVHYATGESSVRAVLDALDKMLATLVHVDWYRERICVVVDADVPDQRINEWRTHLADSGARVTRTQQAGIELYYPTALLERVSGLTSTDVPLALRAWLADIKKGQKDPPFGNWHGGKRQLSEEIAALLVPEHLMALPAELKAVLDAVRDNRLSAPMQLVSQFREASVEA